MLRLVQRQITKAVHEVIGAFRVRPVLYLAGYSPVVIHADFFVERGKSVKNKDRSGPILAPAQ